ncbi:MAG: hypothetical protein HGA45_32470 [Chloroflexales bacterium]|nr:hypothetical protein [Chloroflexales bacterium]
MAPPPPPPDTLGAPEDLPVPLINSLALDLLLARDPSRAAALLRLLPGEAYITLAERHAALAHTSLTRILVEWAELLELTGSPKVPPRPRTPRRPSITPRPTIPRRPPRAPHGPGDGRRRRWPRIRMRSHCIPAWA